MNRVGYRRDDSHRGHYARRNDDDLTSQRYEYDVCVFKDANVQSLRSRLSSEIRVLLFLVVERRNFIGVVSVCASLFAHGGETKSEIRDLPLIRRASLLLPFATDHEHNFHVEREPPRYSFGEAPVTRSCTLRIDIEDR